MNFKTVLNITRETLDILESGKYMLGGEEKVLPLDKEAMRRVTVITPDMVAKYRTEKFDTVNENTKISVEPLDSYCAAEKYAGQKTLVLNFANGYRAGGGFLHGAFAQEESLCRSSTLYASISSEEAAEMYNYNREHRGYVLSDYMLISEVVVFRKEEALLSDPFRCHVLTYPAPNLYESVEDLTGKLSEVMTNRIENLLCVAAARKFDVLVLGAWGCGAFGHDAKDMADDFYKVLVRKNYKKYFKEIVFAIYNNGKTSYNFNCFRDRFCG